MNRTCRIQYRSVRRGFSETRLLVIVLSCHCWLANIPEDGLENSLLGCNAAERFEFTDGYLLSGKYPSNIHFKLA